MVRKTLTVLGCSALLMAVGCGGEGNGNSNGNGNGITGNDLEQLEFSRMLDFRGVPVGLRVTENLRISNLGTRTIRVDGIEEISGLSGTGYTFVIPADRRSGFEIPAGTPTLVEFSFEAFGEVESATAQVRIVLSTGETAEVTIQARTATALEITPLELAFGNTTVGWPGNEEITIRNLLDRPIPVYVQNMNGRAVPTKNRGEGIFDIEAALEGDQLANANPLLPMQEATVRVTYIPDSEVISEDTATWDLGPCPNLSLCGQRVRITGRPIQDVITCDTESLDVGSLNPPQTFSSTVTCSIRERLIIENVRGPSLSATGIRITPKFEPGMQLDGDMEFQFVVSFDPSRVPVGTDTSDDIQVLIRDARDSSRLPTLRIPIRAANGRPVLSASPETLDFQTVRVDSIKPDFVTITNSGPVAFEGRVRLEPDVDSVFSTAFNEVISIPAGESRSYEFEYSPTTAGSLETKLVFTTSNDRDTDLRLEVPVVGTAQILLTCGLGPIPSALDFGRTAPGVEALEYVVLKNNQSSNCIVNGIRFSADSDPAFQVVSPAPRSEVVIPGNGALVIEVAYTPEVGSTGSASGTLEFYTSADPAFKEIPSSGQASLANVLALPNALDFRGGDSNCSGYELPLQIMNGTPGPLNVTNMEITGPGAIAFSLETNGSFPQSLPNRGSFRSFAVVYEPQGPNDVSSALLEVRLDDGSVPFIIPLVGSASPNGTAVEAFEQQPATETRVLFTLPTHGSPGSMEMFLDEMSNAYADFIQPIQDAGLDYRLGFITDEFPATCGNTTVLAEEPGDPAQHTGNCGYLSLGSGLSFREAWRTIDPMEMPDEDTAWRAQVNRDGLPATTTSPALRMLFQAFHPALRTWNEDLFVADVPLHVVVVNNADDSSSNPPESMARFVRYARGYRNRNLQGMSLITGPENMSCTTDAMGMNPIQAANPAGRFHEAAAILGGGPRQSICGDDVGLLMSTAAEGARGIRRFHRLERAVQADSVTVRVDGSPIDAADFAVDVDTQTVELISVPARAAGAQVEIEYTPACLPN